MKTKSKSKGSLVKRGSHYFCMWRHPVDGKPKQFCQVLRDENGVPCTTKPEAEAAKQKLMRLFVKQDEQETLRNIQARITTRSNEISDLTPALPVSKAWEAFASPTSGRRPCEPSTLDAYENIWTQFQRWLEAKHPNVTTLKAVAHAHAKEYLDGKITMGMTGGTFRQHLSVLKYVFKVLKREARLEENVWSEFQPQPVQREARRELTLPELTKICSTAKGEMKVLLCVGMYSGMRLGDCATLRWNEVDLQRRMIRRVPHKIQRRMGAKGMVTIPLHPVLQQVLAALPGEKINGYVTPESAESYLANRSLLARKIRNHFAKCGVEVNKERENGLRRAVLASFHSLRHSFVSMCALNGVALPVVQALVGHATISMTQYYAHSNGASEQAAIAALPAIDVAAVTA